MDPVIPSDELHDQSHTVVTETKLEAVRYIIEVEKVDAMEIESNNVENTQPSCLCVNK